MPRLFVSFLILGLTLCSLSSRSLAASEDMASYIKTTSKVPAEGNIPFEESKGEGDTEEKNDLEKEFEIGLAVSGFSSLSFSTRGLKTIHLFHYESLHMEPEYRPPRA